FILSQTGKTNLSIYNMKGQKVCTLADKPLDKGHHTITWDGTDANGRSVSSGLYFAKIEQGNNHRVHKMMLMK
ncbi:MAG: FlgD immunoglobulin-like domain containing protein, partial [Candidatus Cloacimonetes bacterium]|nr:FlgD immunoglobulin-like domain containing protein [Candidatus Cloacimonadota bacterium]